MFDKNDPRLTAFALGELDEAEQAELAAAIESSPELQAAVEEIKSVCGTLSEGFKDELSLDDAASVLAADRGSVATSKATRQPKRFFWAAACAIAILAISLSVVLIDVGQPFGVSLRGGSDFSTDSWTFYTPQIDESHVRAPELMLPPAENSTGDQSFQTDGAPAVMLPTQQNGDNYEDLDLWVADLPSDRNTNATGSATRGEVDINGRFPKKRQGRFPGRARLKDGIDAIADAVSEMEATTERKTAGEAVARTLNGSKFESSMKTTQRATDQELVDKLLARGAASLESESKLLRSGRQLPLASQAGKRAAEGVLGGDGKNLDREQEMKLAIQTAQQRFGTTHPKVKEMQKDLDEAQADGQAIANTAEAIIPNLLRRVDPSGSKEIEINELESLKLENGLTADLAKSFLGDLRESEPNTPSSGESTRPAIAQGFLSRLEEAENAGGKSSANELSRRFAAETNARLREAVEQHNRAVRQRRGWKRVEATQNTSRLIIGDKDELDLTGMQVHVQVDGFRARVLVDYFYYNDRDQQLEGNFKIRLPDDASLYYFAFGQSAYDFTPDGGLAEGEFINPNNQYVSLAATDIGLARQDAWQNVKEARVVPREKAAFAYSQTVRRRVDPALVEWSGAGIFNARVFPLMPNKLHRVVVGYDVNLTSVEGGYRYQLDLPQQTGQCRVDLSVSEFNGGNWDLTLDDNKEDTDDQSTQWSAAEAAAKIRSQKRMRFDSPDWKSMTLTLNHDKPLLLNSLASEKAKFFATQFKIDLPENRNDDGNQSNGKSRGIFLVDTSLSSRPEKFNVWLDLLKANLENNRDAMDQFAVLFFDVDARFWRTQWTDNSADNVSQLMKDCYQIGLEGATNLHGAVLELRDADWLISENKGADIFLLSDGAANWGETNLGLIQQDLAALQLGSLFAYQTGLSGTAIGNLRHFAGASGGAVFSVASEDEVAAASRAHRNKPWKLESLTGDGADDLLTAGRVQWLYPGQIMTVVGRGNLSDGLEVKLSQGTKTKTVAIDLPVQVESEMASRLYGQVSVGQLESLGDSLFDVSAAYARHFRITGQTCSLLMLESEADYQRFDIKPQEDWFVIQSKNAAAIVADKLTKNAGWLADPKAQLISWIERLEQAPGIEFSMPTALKIVLDNMQIETIDARLDIGSADKDDWPKKYSENLSAEKLDAGAMTTEMERRRNASPDSALRAYSNLVESNPGDWVVARDVAYTAMDLGRPSAAYHLLHRVLRQRPYEGSTYAALGQCLDQLGQADMSVVFYELALAGKYQNQGPDFQRIVATQYRSLLNRIERKQIESTAVNYAAARLESLKKISKLEKSDLIVSMMWNTDQTDVDLHVIEPSGEECYYQHKTTKSGGRITTDKTDGFGPEMYSIASAPAGQYEIHTKLYRSNANRTGVVNKVFLSVYKNYGSSNEEVQRSIVQLRKVKDKELVETITWDK